jgi:MFS family permease
VAQGVLVLQLTHRSVMVGVTQAATFVPVTFIALHGGRLADRFDRRRLLIWTQLLAIGSTAVLAVLAATHRVTVGALLVVAVLLGVQFAIAIPASQALLPSLVPPEELGPAVGLTSVSYNLARVLGPSVATAAVATLGFGLAFGLNSLSFAVLALAIAAIRVPPARRGAESGSDSIREALRVVWRNRRLRMLLAAIVAITIATEPVFTLSPAFAGDVFGRRAADAGLLVSAFGLGAILGAATLGRLLGRSARTRQRLAIGGIVGMSGGVVVLAAAGGFGIGLVGAGLAGVGFLVGNTAVTTDIQTIVPEGLRGRVMAIWTLCFLGLRPVSSIVGGVLADGLSPRVAAALLVTPGALAVAGLLWSAPARERAVVVPAPPT